MIGSFDKNSDVYLEKILKEGVKKFELKFNFGLVLICFGIIGFCFFFILLYRKNYLSEINFFKFYLGFEVMYNLILFLVFFMICEFGRIDSFLECNFF